MNLLEIINKIGADGIHDLWIEAGGRLFSSFVRQRLAHKSIIYVAPKLLGANAYPAFREEIDIFNEAKQVHWHNRGEDAVCEIQW